MLIFFQKIKCASIIAIFRRLSQLIVFQTKSTKDRNNTGKGNERTLIRKYYVKQAHEPICEDNKEKAALLEQSKDCSKDDIGIFMEAVRPHLDEINKAIEFHFKGREQAIDTAIMNGKLSLFIDYYKTVLDRDM